MVDSGRVRNSVVENVRASIGPGDHSPRLLCRKRYATAPASISARITEVPNDVVADLANGSIVNRAAESERSVVAVVKMQS